MTTTLLSNPHQSSVNPVINQLLRRLINGENLTREESSQLLSILIDEQTTDAQIAALLTALVMKGETVEELVGLAQEMRLRSEKVKTGQRVLIDTAGTGSSRVKTFNVSTAAAFIIAGAGMGVAKHGARAATSLAGSADVLSALGVRIDAAPENAACCLDQVGICFMFAPLYHKATARVARVRRELGVQTSFNLLGPLTNPAGAPFQLIGVYRQDVIERVAHAVGLLGARRAWVVHGSDGLDEITISGETQIAEAKDGGVSLFKITPEDFGCQRHDLAALRGGDATANAKIIKDVLLGQGPEAARDIVLLNAAAALYISGMSNTLPDSFRLATESLESGRASNKLEQLISATNQ